MKKIHHMTQGPITVKVHYSADWREYRARLYYYGQAIPALDYFTQDREDAIGTAALMMRHHTKETICHE